MFTQFSDFQAINTDKISRIGAFYEEKENSKKKFYNLYINFDFARLCLTFKDGKSLDAAYNELLTDLNTNKIKPKYDFKNMESWTFDDMALLKAYFDLFNHDFIALNDNLMDTLK